MFLNTCARFVNYSVSAKLPNTAAPRIRSIFAQNQKVSIICRDCGSLSAEYLRVFSAEFSAEIRINAWIIRQSSQKNPESGRKTIYPE